MANSVNDDPFEPTWPEAADVGEDFLPDPDIDFENVIGYGNPPKEHRWKKGDPSPNPSGRPPKDQTKGYRLSKVASRPIQMTVGGRKRTVTTIEAIVLIVKMKAIENDPRAIALAGRLIGEAEPDGETPIQKSVLISRGTLSEEEWMARYGYLRNRYNGSGDGVEAD